MMKRLPTCSYRGASSNSFADSSASVPAARCASHLFADQSSTLLILSPAEKGCLPQLFIGCPLGKRKLTHQFWVNPLEFFGNFWRILDRRFIGKERFESIDCLLQALFAKRGTRMTEVA